MKNVISSLFISQTSAFIIPKIKANYSSVLGFLKEFHYYYPHDLNFSKLKGQYF